MDAEVGPPRHSTEEHQCHGKEDRPEEADGLTRGKTPVGAHDDLEIADVTCGIRFVLGSQLEESESHDHEGCDYGQGFPQLVVPDTIIAKRIDKGPRQRETNQPGPDEPPEHLDRLRLSRHRSSPSTSS